MCYKYISVANGLNSTVKNILHFLYLKQDCYFSAAEGNSRLNAIVLLTNYEM